MRPGNFGGMNMNNLMKQAQKLQQEMEAKQQELMEKEYSSSVGGGMVTAVVKGSQLASISINEEVIDPDDAETLEDLIVAAVNEALSKSAEDSADSLGKLTGGMGIPGLR